MPTILRDGPYRFFFYASDRDEPVHVHVERDDYLAKLWVDPVRLQYSGGFHRTEIRHIVEIIQSHEAEIVEAWHEYFGS